jgi:acetylxylan esterase
MRPICKCWGSFQRTLLISMLFAAILALVFPAMAGAFTEITDFSAGGRNPTGLKMFLYTPATMKKNPAILVGVHWCHGTAKSFHEGRTFKTLADKYGFIIVYPNANSSDSCFDVHSEGTLHHDSAGDACGIVSMVKYAVKTYNADSTRVFVTGHSSGGMMTNVMIGAYPEVFRRVKSPRPRRNGVTR